MFIDHLQTVWSQRDNSPFPRRLFKPNFMKPSQFFFCCCIYFLSSSSPFPVHSVPKRKFANKSSTLRTWKNGFGWQKDVFLFSSENEEGQIRNTLSYFVSGKTKKSFFYEKLRPLIAWRSPFKVNFKIKEELQTEMQNFIDDWRQKCLKWLSVPLEDLVFILSERQMQRQRRISVPSENPFVLISTEGVHERPMTYDNHPI